MSVIETPSPNHEPRPAGSRVDTLVLHYTGMRDAAAALARLRDPAARVSAHWLVEEDGTVHRLVPEERRAWHAGVACWRGAPDINDRSVGIELVNPGHEFGYRPFPAAQVGALEALAGGILGRHPIPAARVVGHADVAPDRKQDPGELFPWARLAAAGIGLWPDPGNPPPAPSGAAVPGLLAAVGYCPEPGVAACLRAFQQHFHPQRLDGTADAPTRARLARVAEAFAEG